MRGTLLKIRALDLSLIEQNRANTGGGFSLSVKRAPRLAAPACAGAQRRPVRGYSVESGHIILRMRLPTVSISCEPSSRMGLSNASAPSLS